MKFSVARLSSDKVDAVMNSLLASRGLLSTSSSPSAAPFLHSNEDNKSVFIRSLHQKAVYSGGLPFYEMLSNWISITENQSDTEGECVLSKVPLRESQLLNLKINDPCFNIGYIKPTHGSEALPVNSQNVSRDPQLDEWGSGFFLNIPENDSEGDENNRGILQRFPGEHFNCYSIVHFAAELGDVDWLRELALTHTDSCVGIPFYSAHHLRCRTTPESFPSFDTLASSGFDFNGNLPSHSAAEFGNVEVLEFLMSRYTPDVVLRAKKERSVRSALWGAEVHADHLNTVGCAVTESQLDVLEYVYRHYPSVLTMMNVNELDCALTGVSLKEDNTTSFEFFLKKNIITPPMNSENSVSAVLRNGCGGAFGAAAEAGQVNILLWMADVFGESVLWTPGRGGATAIHHCARGGNAAALRTLLQRSPAVRQHVDDLDEKGRTPAMWTVLARNRATKTIDTLKVLREAGSEWNTEDSFPDLLRAAQKHSSPFSKLMRYLNSQSRR